MRRRGASITLAAEHPSLLPPAPLPAEGSLLTAHKPGHPTAAPDPGNQGIFNSGAYSEPSKSDLTGDHSVSKLTVTRTLHQQFSRKH